jgi:putative endonuclease
MIPPPDYQGNLKNMAYVYLLRSLSKGIFYLGWTTNLKRRLDQHNNGESSYTKSRGPWQLMTYETYANSQQAKARERQLKQNPRMFSLFKKRALLGMPLADRQVVG